jgi:hypothetical protein
VQGRSQVVAGTEYLRQPGNRSCEAVDGKELILVRDERGENGMTKQLLFWVLMLIWLVFSLWFDYVPGQPYPMRRGIYGVLLFVLLAVLGWAVFGAPVKS